LSRWDCLIEIGSELSADVLRRLVPPHRVGVVTDDAGYLVDSWEIEQGRLLWLVDQGSSRVVVPVVDDGGIRRAQPGDRFISAIPPASSGRFRSTIALPDQVRNEERIVVDQTNESFILDGAFVVKWQLVVGKSVALAKERILARANFPHTPESFGDITWMSDSGEELLVASVQSYLSDSSDGWTWCVAKAMDNDRSEWVENIAAVVASMHEVFADSNSAHGDLHVGQFLYHDGNYFVIDFDGHPLGNSAESWLGDLVSMLCSFIHVGGVAEVKYGAPHDMASWIAEVSKRFLDHYLLLRPGVELPDEESLVAMMAENEQRERDYATRFLPEWTYAADYGIDYVERRRRESSRVSE